MDAPACFPHQPPTTPGTGAPGLHAGAHNAQHVVRASLSPSGPAWALSPIAPAWALRVIVIAYRRCRHACHDSLLAPAAAWCSHSYHPGLCACNSCTSYGMHPSVYTSNPEPVAHSPTSGIVFPWYSKHPTWPASRFSAARPFSARDMSGESWLYRVCTAPYLQAGTVQSEEVQVRGARVR